MPLLFLFSPLSFSICCLFMFVSKCYTNMGQPSIILGCANKYKHDDISAIDVFDQWDLSTAILDGGLHPWKFYKSLSASFTSWPFLTLCWYLIISSHLYQQINFIIYIYIYIISTAYYLHKEFSYSSIFITSSLPIFCSLSPHIQQSSLCLSSLFLSLTIFFLSPGFLIAFARFSYSFFYFQPFLFHILFHLLFSILFGLILQGISEKLFHNLITWPILFQMISTFNSMFRNYSKFCLFILFRNRNIIHWKIKVI